MYGALRTRANNSTHVAGISVAALITTLAGYALANGFAMDLARIIETPITFTPLSEETTSDEPLKQTEFDMSDATKIETPLPLGPVIEFIANPEGITGTTTPRAPDPVANTGGAAAPKLIRTRPTLIPQEPPPYPASEIRKQNQGVSTLDVCVDAKGRISAASFASSSGHSVLDNAALKWVRSARFTPGKLDGVPQSVCGHTFAYEWNLEDARK
ncbi:MAG: energy transducer TonB [Hyphomonadaceae bacterium]|nr:energy transducer TonB [Hyphomonadaceae bacterium]